MGNQAGAIYQQMEEIRNAAKKDNRSLTSEEKEKWDKLMEEYRMENDMQSVMNQEGRSVVDRPEEKESFVFADIARSLKFGGEAKDVPSEIRAVTSSSGSAAIQDPHVVDKIIYELQSSNQLAEAGADFRNITNYMQMPKVTTYPNYHWQASEGDEIPVDTAMVISSKKWELKDLAIRVRVSNQYLMDSGTRGRKLVERSMVKQINQAIAQAVFTGTGLSGQPGGIETFSGLQTVDIDPDAVMTDWEYIIDACRLLATVNVPISEISCFFSPTGWAQLASFAAVDGQPLRLPKLLEPVRFFNPSTLILETYDSSTTTKFFLGNFNNLVVGFQGLFNITLDQPRANFLETEFLVHMRLDVQALYENNFCEISGILLS